MRLDFEDGQWYINYSIDKEFRGKGFGTKMLSVLLNENHFGNIKALVKEENIASAKVFEKVGFQKIGTIVVNGFNTHVYKY